MGLNTSSTIILAGNDFLFMEKLMRYAGKKIEMTPGRMFRRLIEEIKGGEFTVSNVIKGLKFYFEHWVIILNLL